MKGQRDFWYLTNCVCCAGPNPGAAINSMAEQASDITRRTFLTYVNANELHIVEDSLEYDRHPARGLTMAGDWHVSYHKSRFRGVPVVYFRHSAIEYIFTAPRFTTGARRNGG